MSYKVIYLTGAPAAGKTTICNQIRERISNVEIFQYGSEMSAYLTSQSKGSTISQKDLRAGTATHVTQLDIDHVNRRMVEFSRRWRTKKHVVIDTHQVTRERYGFRVSAFSNRELRALQLTEIWILYASAASTIARIRQRPEGRPEPNVFEADLHTFLQASLIVSYGVIFGVPIVLFDSEVEHAVLIQEIENRLRIE